MATRGITPPLAFILVLGLALTINESSANTRARNLATKEVLSTLRDPQKYDNLVLPLNETGGATHCDITIMFRNIEVDDASQQMTVDMTFRMTWKDPRLAFKTPGVEQITLSAPELAWVPDAFFKKAVRTEQQVTVRPDNYLRVFPNGNLKYSARFVVTFSCPMDFTRFPHDKQKCPIKIASYGYTTDDLVFKFAPGNPITTNRKLDSINFAVDTMVEGLEIGSCTSQTSTGIYSCVEVNMNLDRYMGSYVIQWYIPCIFLVLVAAMSEITVASEFLARILLTVVPLIALWMFSTLYSLYRLPSVTYTRPIDIFSGISLLVIFCQLIRVMVLQYYAQRKILEEKGEILPRHPRDDCFEKLIVNANLISRVVLVAFYCLFLFAYFVAYST